MMSYTCNIIICMVLGLFQPNQFQHYLNKDKFERNHKVTPKYRDVPVIGINVYVMGRDSIARDVALSITKNIEFLNNEFEGQIIFEFDNLHLDPFKAYLPDLRKKVAQNDFALIEKILAPVEIKGSINLYIFDTYLEEGQQGALMGFTPRLRSNQSQYGVSSPEFDRIFISYEGLQSETTLIHEMGHFLGLNHPWELSSAHNCHFGMCTAESQSINHMSYGPDVKEFTSQQLISMQHHALKYRMYLTKKIQRIYAST